MKRLLVTCAVAAPMALAACGGGEVVVQAQLDNRAGETRAMADLPIRALPFDRDEIFDSLALAYGTPEPAIPPEFDALQDSIAEAQATYQDANARWGAARDSLATLDERMKGMDRSSGAYVVAYGQFSDQERVERTAEQQRDGAFARYESQLGRFTEQQTELQIQRQLWRDEAYANIDDVIDMRLDELGRDIHADTTSENGVARFTLPPGEWWIQAWHELPFSELYWNVPVQVERSDPIQVILNRANAVDRPKF
ncbi:MAG: hypothetical protein WEB88_00185 [Gemmatimonadota bacterium]